MIMQSILEIDGLKHALYDIESGDTFTVAINRPLTFCAGCFTTILGPSGCGKTTLLTLLGLLRRPSHPKEIKLFRITNRKGETVNLADLWQRGEEQTIEQLRRQSIGFALQSGELLPFLTVSENIAVPLRLNGISDTDSSKRVAELLQAFELVETGKKERIANARVNKLSGGEFQRVVLARAIAHSPEIVFVDEPTSALNRELARNALKQLRQLTSSAIVMITHDTELAKEFSDQVIEMEPKGKTGIIKNIVALNSSVPSSHV
jgi:ABC-type lipoprotein export system ATPase subunit